MLLSIEMSNPGGRLSSTYPLNSTSGRLSLAAKSPVSMSPDTALPVLSISAAFTEHRVSRQDVGDEYADFAAEMSMSMSDLAAQFL